MTSVSKIWKMEPWFPYELDGVVFNAAVSVNNWEELMAAKVGRSRWLTMPPVDLTLDLDDVAVDCFDMDAFTFVSKAMRDALSPSTECVDYVEVLPDRLSPAARRMDYRVLNVFALEDAIDLEVSEYTLLELPGRPPTPMFGPIALKAELIPKHELFRDRAFPGGPFAVDAVALRVLKAGCTGVRFCDPSTFARPSRFRSLRGLEAEGDYNTMTKTMQTTLVEAIPGLQ